MNTDGLHYECAYVLSDGWADWMIYYKYDSNMGALHYEFVDE
jgi:hypothetical protein